MGGAVAITRVNLTAAELRAAAGREKDGSAARRMLALAMVLDGADRKSAAETCGMDRHRRVNRKYMIVDSTRNKTPQKPLGLHYNKIPISAPCNDSAFTAKKPENRNFQSPVGKVGLTLLAVTVKSTSPTPLWRHRPRASVSPTALLR